MPSLATYRGLGSPAEAVEFISTASTAVTLTYDQQEKLLVYNGQTSAARIRLPAPETGMTFRVLFNSGAVSTATKVLSSGVYDILTADTTGKGVSVASTVERGCGIQLYAINEYRWIASRFGGSTLALLSTST